MIKRIALGLGLFLLLAVAGLFLAGQSAEDHLKKGDEYYSQLEDQKALEEYLAAAQVDSNNFEAMWKTARSLIDVGDLVDTKEKGYEAKQKKYYTDAAGYARRAIALNDNITWGHFYLAAAQGKYALMLGKKDQVRLSKEIKAEIEKAIELDNTNDGAYHALGRWHRRMAEIGGAERFFGGILFGSIPKGSFEESEKNLKKAVELKPEYINHHLELGRTYVALEKYDLAAEEFQKCLDLPASTSKDPGYKKEAQDELAKIQKKLKK
jgi:tetratricopeptide (TPR) repeat protein